MKSNKGILITGASGFIGSSLIKRFKMEGIPHQDLPHELLYRESSLKAFLRNNHYDYILHLASYGNLFSQTDDNKTIEANIAGVYNLLEATRGIEYKAFVNFSSSSILLPYTTFYSAGKVAGELIARAFQLKYSKPVMSVRPSSVYGIGDNPVHFIPQLINNLKNDRDMKVDLGPTHDWIYIEDLSARLLTCITNIEILKGLSVNISTNIKTTNKEVIHILEKISGKKLNYKAINAARPYDDDNWKVENNIIKGLGWKPQFSLEEGLRMTYEKQII